MSKLFTATVARYKLIKPAPYVASYQRHRIDGDVYYMHCIHNTPRRSLALFPFLFMHFLCPYCYDIFAHNVNVDKINNSPKILISIAQTQTLSTKLDFSVFVYLCVRQKNQFYFSSREIYTNQQQQQQQRWNKRCIKVIVKLFAYIVRIHEYSAINGAHVLLSTGVVVAVTW